MTFTETCAKISTKYNSMVPEFFTTMRFFYCLFTTITLFSFHFIDRSFSATLFNIFSLIVAIYGLYSIKEAWAISAACDYEKKIKNTKEHQMRYEFFMNDAKTISDVDGQV